jgi:hypothetical protein
MELIISVNYLIPVTKYVFLIKIINTVVVVVVVVQQNIKKKV